MRWIAPQRHHVFDPGFLQPTQQHFDFLTGVADAGKMCHRLDVELVLKMGGQRVGVLASASSCAVGHGEVVRAELGKGAQRLLQGFHALSGFCRKNLDGKDEGLAAIEVDQFHRSLMPQTVERRRLMLAVSAHRQGSEPASVRLLRRQKLCVARNLQSAPASICRLRSSATPGARNRDR